MSKILLAMSVASLALIPTMASANIVDIAATNPTNINAAAIPVTENFAAGTYNVQVVGTPGGGQYDAWTPAQPAAGNYDERYTISYGSTTTTVNPFSGQRFATALDALNAFSGIVTSFTLATASAVTFSIPDYMWWDNTGGVSVNVTPAAAVPEPGMLALFGLGVAGLMLLQGRRNGRLIRDLSY